MDSIVPNSYDNDGLITEYILSQIAKYCGMCDESNDTIASMELRFPCLFYRLKKEDSTRKLMSLFAFLKSKLEESVCSVTH